MRAVGFVARHDVRRRRRSLAVITVVVGLVGAVVLASAAGARRTASSLERFESASRTATVELTMLGRPTQRQRRALRAVPGVRAIAALRAYAVVVPGAPELETIGAPIDRSTGTTVDRIRIVRGRAPRASAPDEIALGEALAQRLHLGPGDRLRIATQSPEQSNRILAGAPDVGPPAGPSIVLHVVGVQRSPRDLGDRAANGGFLVLPPTFDAAWAGRVGRFGSYVRIRADTRVRSVPEVISAARNVLGGALFSAQGLNVETKGPNDAIDVLTIALWIFAGLAAVGGIVAITIALSRALDDLGSEQHILRSLGFTRRQQLAIGAIPAVPVALGGAVLAVAGAVIASPLLPFGIARRADPDVGVHADALVLASGVLMIFVVTTAIAVAAAVRRTLPTPADATGTRGQGRSSAAWRTPEHALAPPAAIGIRMAFQRGRGRASVPVRSAAAGAVLGVLGIAAVLGFTSSLQRLARTPGDFGWTWDFQSRDTTSNTACGTGSYGLAREPALESLSELCFQNMQVEGQPVGGISFLRLSGAPIEPEVLEGRAPQRRDEVALGTATMHDLGKGIGDRVHVRHGDRHGDYRVVGRVVFPTLGLQPLSDGIAFTGAGFRPLYDADLFTRYFVGRYAPGADRRAFAGRLRRVPQLSAPVGAAVPVEIDRVRDVSWVPTGLSLLFGALGIFAIGFALVTSVRRRRRELAVMKALGFERKQVRATIAWQATALTVLGLVIGIPLGVLCGNVVWRLVADGLGIVAPPAVPLLALTALILGALVVVNLVAAFPGAAAARTPTATALRSE
jgi:ABC-type lipoprotein release transport system permease subunit